MPNSSIEIQARQALLRRGIWTLIEQGETLETLLSRLVENIEAQAEKMLAAIFLYDPLCNELTIGAAPNLQPVYKKAVNGFSCGPNQPACGSAVFKRQQVICEDVRSDPLWVNLREFAEAIGIRAVWSQPILAGDGAVLGTLAFYFPEPKSPSNSDLLVLETSAGVAALAVQARLAQASSMMRARRTQSVIESGARHQCFIYEGPPSHQLPMLATVLQRKLGEGYRCLYLNSPAMVAGLRSCLTEMGLDVVSETEKGRLVLSSDSPVSPTGGFDPDQMLHLLEEALENSVKDGFKGLWASGDMSWEFGAKKDFSRLLEYEARLEQIFRRSDKLCGICQYHKDFLPSEAMRAGLISHSAFFVNDTLTRANPLRLTHEASAGREATDAELDELIAQLCKA